MGRDIRERVPEALRAKSAPNRPCRDFEAPLNDFVPPPGAFVYPLTVQPADIDYLGHANNVVWVRWVNEAAIAHSEAVGLGAAAYFELKVLWVVRRHDIEYLFSALEGDELHSTTWVAEMKAATCLRHTVVTRVSDGKLLSRASTTWALIDAVTGRPKRVPPEIAAKYAIRG
jgi:acyl-CoA thioester hydrolase